eukprot:TRINITY_DN2158_c0_g1_i1.p1 TRINITY_DN2158_c0_g1~~TRINITY_DN2158_c0_g1_i1.p1  ORF type:complete len:142 (+),score=34.16 TRINITY_DN2158_c0_g1_i1:118-543(+)
MNTYSYIFIFAALLFTTLNAQVITPCGDANDHLNVKNVYIEPATPTKGQNLTVYVVGTLDEQVTGGTVKVEIKYAGTIPVYDKTYPLCSDVLKCPIAQGTFYFNHTVEVPSSIPNGNYKGSMVYNDENDSEIACFNLVFSL